MVCLEIPLEMMSYVGLCHSWRLKGVQLDFSGIFFLGVLVLVEELLVKVGLVIADIVWQEIRTLFRTFFWGNQQKRLWMVVSSNVRKDNSIRSDCSCAYGDKWNLQKNRYKKFLNKEKAKLDSTYLVQFCSSKIMLLSDKDLETI